MFDINRKKLYIDFIGSGHGEFDLNIIVTKAAKTNDLAHIVVYRNIS